MGPLKGLRVLEIESIGPVPWVGMMLADMGADVLRVDRRVPPDLGIERPKKYVLTDRGRRSVLIDLKSDGGRADFLRLVAKADVLIEGMRPGVMERLGIGPEVCHAINQSLVFGRMTGWGQTGPLARDVGHDLNYIAITGALSAIGPKEGAPVIRLSLVGDYGGGGMLLLVGVLAACMERQGSGKGQVVDAAMVDGVLALLAPVLGRYQSGEWKNDRESNVLDGGSHFYQTYKTLDGEYVTVGAIEPKFYLNLLRVLGLDPAGMPPQHDRASWPGLKARFAELFARKTRADWVAAFEGVEICFAPALKLDELRNYPHHVHRQSLLTIDGVMHQAPAPRFSRSQSAIAAAPAERGTDGREALLDWGFGEPETDLQATSWK